MRSIIYILIFITSSNFFSQEICDNGIDDDLDGLVDYQDTNDCHCKNIYNLIPNPSFEDTVYCPFSISQMSAVRSWLQGSTGGTTDYLNKCRYSSNVGFPPPSIDKQMGNGYLGFIDILRDSFLYKEYAAICLDDTLFAGENYEIKFRIALGIGEPIITMGIYGSNNCADIPFSGFGCPTSDSNFIGLDSVTILTNSHSWQTSTFSFTTPINITNFIIGPACTTTLGVDQPNYYYFDIIEYKKNVELEMPNVFSPNNDGINDFFIPIKSNCISDFNFHIYNRWGQIVYETNSFPISWDGTTNEKRCSEGVYFWTLNSNTLNQKLKGNISLFR